MNLKQYKAEIFRRSEVKIKKRKQARRIALICIPLVLVVAALLAVPEQNTERSRQELAQDSDGMTMGSIYCSYVRAELRVDGNPISIDDKLKVDKIFTIVSMKQELADEAEPESAGKTTVSVNENLHYGLAPPKYLVILYTEDGSSQAYSLTQEEYEAVLEVIK